MASVALNGPVLDSIPTPTGNGYYMVAADGGIFTFGDASFSGSMGGKAQRPGPVASSRPRRQGLLAGRLRRRRLHLRRPFRGSMGDVRLNKPMTGMVPYGNGYLMVAEDGGIFNFSNRAFVGSLGDNPPARPMVSVAGFG